MDKGKYGRKDRLIREKRHDTYRSRGKQPGGAVCKPCGAVVQEGRWTWNRQAWGTERTTCPACRRIADNYPAGYLEMEGPFFTQHRGQILGLIRNVADREKSQRPLERIMKIRREGSTTLVTTTGVHIARRLGDSLKRSYQGDLNVNYEEGEKRIRVSWVR